MDILVLGLAEGATIGLLALGIVLVFKTTGALNFAQGEFGTWAVYMAWLFIDWGMPWGVGAILAIASMVGIALVAERYVFRPMLGGPRLALTVATLGVMTLLGLMEIKLFGASPRILAPPVAGRGIELAGVFLDPPRLIALAATGLIAGALFLVLKRTTFGLGVLAAAEDPQTVRLMGIRLSRISMFTWGSAAAIGAVAGLLVLPAVGTFEPFSMTSLFVKALAAALLGGMRSLPGALAGGVGVGVLDAAVRTWFIDLSGAVDLAILGLILMVLLLRPQGLLGKAAAA